MGEGFVICHCQIEEGEVRGKESSGVCEKEERERREVGPESLVNFNERRLSSFFKISVDSVHEDQNLKELCGACEPSSLSS
jgi:hypothetical protein